MTTNINLEKYTDDDLDFFLNMYLRMIDSSKSSLEYWERMKKETEAEIKKRKTNKK